MRQPSTNVAAIIPAAGVGTRFGARVGKPFVLVNGQPLLVHTLQCLQSCSAIRWILPVVRQADVVRVAGLLKRHQITKALTPCVGGSSRAESVAKGFEQLPAGAQWVLIHDGARPCASRRLIQEAVRAAMRYGAVACGLPATLTVKAVDTQHDVRLTLDRDQLWFVQTPQVFRRDWFAQALQKADHCFSDFPDDAAMVESAGFPVRMIRGESLNLKVTTRDDLVLVEAILRQDIRSRK